MRFISGLGRPLSSQIHLNAQKTGTLPVLEASQELSASGSCSAGLQVCRSRPKAQAALFRLRLFGRRLLCLKLKQNSIQGIATVGILQAKATFCTDDRAVSLTRRFQGLSGGTSNSVHVPTSTRPSGSACTTIHPLPLPPSAFCCVAVNASWPGAVLDTYWFCWVVDDTIHMLASTCCGLHIYLLVWLGWGGP